MSNKNNKTRFLEQTDRKRTETEEAISHTSNVKQCECVSLAVFVVALVQRRTRDRKVAGSTPGWGAIKSTRSTQPSITPGWVNRVPAFMAGARLGAFTCVRWQVTLCDATWQVTSCSSEIGFP